MKRMTAVWRAALAAWLLWSAWPALAAELPPLSLADAKAKQVEATAPNQALVAADGSPASVVPEELHNYLHVQKDANGSLRVVETQGADAPAKAVEVSHE